MWKQKRIILIPILVLILAGLACNYPGMLKPTPFVFSTPNYTLTAVFSSETQTPISPVVTEAIQATNTPLPEIPTLPPPTPSPTDTSLPPTATHVPPTHAPPPTKTTKPTQSTSGPAKRPGVSIEALYFKHKPSIDGEFSEWTQDRINFSNVVYGEQNWSGPEDLSAKVVVGWDDDFLYLATKVVDDRYVQTASGENLFKGDSLEVLLDQDVPGDYYLKSLNRDDYQIGISPGKSQVGTDTKAYLWYPQAISGTLKDVIIAAVQVEDGYRVEVAIPWDYFKIKPQSGMHFGFALSVSDNDKADKQLQQTLISTSPKRVLTDPTTWGDLVLIK